VYSASTVVQTGVARITAPDFRADPSDPSAWVEAERDLLRSLPHRRVYRAAAGGLGVVVKEYRPRGILDRLRRRASRESELAAEAKRRGVPVVEPVALCRLPGGVERLFLREETGAITLQSAVERGGLRGPRRHDLARAVGGLLARLHAAGLRHADLHARNILVRPDGGLVFADAAALRPRGRLSARARARQLAQFAPFFLVRATRPDLLLFWGSYGRASGLSPESLERLRLAVAAELPRAFARLSRRRARAALRRGAPVASGGFRGVAFAPVPAPLLESACAFAAEPVGGPAVLKRSPTCWTFRVGDDLVAKAFLPKRATRPWRDLFRGTRAERAHRAAHALRHRGVATPEVVAVMKRGFPPRRSLLIMRRLEGFAPVDDVAAHLGGASGAALAARIGRTLRRMHDWGLRHRDLKASNVRAARDGSGVTLLDLDGVRENRSGAVPWRRRARDLARLAASIPDRRAVPRGLRLRALDAYLGGEVPPGFAPGGFPALVARLADGIRARKGMR